MKKLVFIAMIACALVFAGTTAAFANFGPHGGYAADTDACASCHRAHTATSGLTWKDGNGEQKNALLISDAISETEFCYACHGDGAPGAGTNVESGVFDAVPTGTNSVQGAALNGGGFAKIGGEAGKTVMSSHGVEGLDATKFIRWGYVNGGTSDLTAMTSFTCTDCHDPHGSSNYRLLKDVVNGVTVGGYVGTNNTPAPFVVSNEQGYPSGGWAKGDAGAAQMAVYKPSYTSAQYAANAPNGKAMSAWCAACHTVYAQSDSNYDYGSTIPLAGSPASTVKMYHRHPIDVPLSVGTSPNAEDRSLITQLLNNKDLPLENGTGRLPAGFTYAAGQQAWDDNGNVSCLTCHRAHGTEATMEGWAASPLGTTGAETGQPVLNPTVNGGVNPTFDAALLRMDNRGVCEACHNK